VLKHSFSGCGPPLAVSACLGILNVSDEFPNRTNAATHSYFANISRKNEWCKFFCKKNDFFLPACSKKGDTLLEYHLFTKNEKKYAK
jgi:hypothetical protein